MLTDIDIQALLDKQKKGEGFLVVTTGTPHCGRKEVFLPGLEKLCKKKGKKIKFHNIGDKLFRHIWEATRVDIPPDRVLYANKMLMASTQLGIFKLLCYELKEDLKEYDIVVVNLHARFYWWQGSISIPVYNEVFVRNLIEFGLKPDFLVCFIDNAMHTAERMKESSGWKDEKLSEEKIYLWQNEEVNATGGYLFLTDERINFFVMPIAQPPETLYYLVFEPWRPIIYAQMPISNVKAGKLKKVIWLINQVREDAIVFDPLTIETGVIDTAMFEQFDENKDIIVRNMQTSYRDDEWFIPQVHICMSFHVEIVFTFGVVDETVHGAQLGRDLWSIFPGDLSPFQPYRIHHTRIFKNTEDCLSFFRDEFMVKIYKKWGVEPPKREKKKDETKTKK